jgi:hypothetical protein
MYILQSVKEEKDKLEAENERFNEALGEEAAKEANEMASESV